MARMLETLLGEYVIRHNGEKVVINSLCGKDSIVGIYFSAEWCPPCKGFTPKLVELYCKIKEKGHTLKFEIVFVSWDKDEASFKDNFQQMPWLALPFGDQKKAKLCKKFRVQGIPKLVLIDGDSGKTITRDGYSCVSDDASGLEFPWQPKQFYDIIKGKLLKEGKEVDSFEELKGKIVGLFFSAHWCPPCRVFTPELMVTYEQLKSEGKNFEILFVSSDRSEDSFTSYANSMPWSAVPFGDQRSQMLKSLYEVEGIPMLVILDESGNVINMDGRLSLNEDRNGKEFPWYPKPINELTEGAAIQLNESACVVLFVEPEDEEVDKAREFLLQSSIEEQGRGEHRDLLFFIGADEEICESVRMFAGLPEQNPLLTILDFPEQKVYICEEKELSADLVNKFVKGYLDETLPSRSCKHNSP